MQRMRGFGAMEYRRPVWVMQTRDTRVLKIKNIIFAALVLILLLPGSTAAFSLTGSPVLSITPESIDFGVVRTSETATRSITIGGRGEVRWVVKWMEPWLTLDAHSGVVVDDIHTLSVTADPRGLSLGRHTAQIIIVTSSGTRTIPVTITVLQGSDGAPPPVLKDIALVPPTVAAQVGRKVQVGAVGLYSDGSRKEITDTVRWVSENGRVASFLEEDGLLLGKAVGSARVFAQEGGVTSPSLTITVEALDGPLLKVYMPKITLDHMEKDSRETLSLSVRNAGAEILEWEVRASVPWLIVEGGTLFRHGDSPLRGTDSGQVRISVDTSGLPDGKHEGALMIRSNGGDERITVPINVLSLTSISLTPVSIRMAVHDRMLFRATGIWSDGSRTDLSSESGCRWVLSDPSVGTFLRRKPIFIAAAPGRTEIHRLKGEVKSNGAVVTVEEPPAIPVLFVSSRELDLGAIGPGESSRGTIVLRNVGGGELIWQVPGVEGWSSVEGESLSDRAGRSGNRLRVSVESAPVESDEFLTTQRFNVLISLETNRKSVFFEKKLPSGDYSEELKFHFNDGERTVFLKFTLADKKSRSTMMIHPLGVDFGRVAAEGKLVKKLELRNGGEKILTWGVALQGGRRTFRGTAYEKGRYISFANEAGAGTQRYQVPSHLRDSASISGDWAAKRGYPTSTGGDAAFRYSFSGGGITVFLWRDVGGGIVEVYVDGRLAGEIDCYSDVRERVEFAAAEGLEENKTHTLVLVMRDGTVEVEGVRLYTSDLMTGKRGWIRVSPEKGTTANEVDYITVTVNPEGLLPGFYSENIMFYSDETVEIVEASLEVASLKAPELIDIYRYTKGADIRLSSVDDQEKLVTQGYRKEGPIFKLFRKGTTGTVDFLQWHNPIKGTHFYSYDPSGGKRSLEGYILDGPIGNIATLRLPHTRDLYRWYNPQTESYLYTTDPKGEGSGRKGYVYDGVAGYVR